MKRRHLGADRRAAASGPQSRRAAVIVVILTLLAVMAPAPAIAGPGSTITGIAWARAARAIARACSIETASGFSIITGTPWAAQISTTRR